MIPSFTTYAIHLQYICQGRTSSTVARALAFHVANPSLIPAGPLSTARRTSECRANKKTFASVFPPCLGGNEAVLRADAGISAGTPGDPLWYWGSRSAFHGPVPSPLPAASLLPALLRPPENGSLLWLRFLPSRPPSLHQLPPRSRPSPSLHAQAESGVTTGLLVVG